MENFIGSKEKRKFSTEIYKLEHVIFIFIIFYTLTSLLVTSFLNLDDILYTLATCFLYVLIRLKGSLFQIVIFSIII